MAKKKKAKKTTTKPKRHVSKQKIRQTSNKARGNGAKKPRSKNPKRKSNKSKLVRKIAKVPNKVQKQKRKSISIPKEAKSKKRSKGIKKSYQKKQVKHSSPSKKIEVTRLKQKDNPRFYSNVLLVKVPPRISIDNKIESINDLTAKDVKYYVDRQYPKFPRGYQIILQTRKGKETFEKANKFVTDKDVNIDNIKKSIQEEISDYQENYTSLLEEMGEDDLADSDWVYNPKSITAVYIRFFY